MCVALQSSAPLQFGENDATTVMFSSWMHQRGEGPQFSAARAEEHAPGDGKSVPPVSHVGALFFGGGAPSSAVICVKKSPVDRSAILYAVSCRGADFVLRWVMG
jgi:hypothetical protein